FLPREGRPPREYGFDHGLAFAVEGPNRDPVSDRGKLLFGQLPGRNAAHAAALRDQLTRPVVTRSDARRHQVVCCVCPERGREEAVRAGVWQVQDELLWLEDGKRPVRARTVSLRSARC